MNIFCADVGFAQGSANAKWLQLSIIDVSVDTCILHADEVLVIARKEVCTDSNKK